MYRKRTFHRRPRRRSFNRTARPATRVGSQRWQWGNFFASTTIQGPGAGGASTNILFEIASLEPNHFGDTSTPGAAALAITNSNQVKGLDIGGIVFDSGIHNAQSVFDVSGSVFDKRMFLMQGIILDKKDPTTGAPSSTNANYAVSTFPSNVVDITVPRPSALQEVRDYPSRFLYRSTDYYNAGLQANISPDDELLASRTRQEVLNPQRHRSLRIKRRLTDDWGLYWVGSIWSPSAPDPSSWVLWLSGSIYYRVVW